MSSEPRDVKKKGRVVASRYKQAAENFTKPKIADETLHSKSKVNQSINPSFLDSVTPTFGPKFNMRKKGGQEFTSTPMFAIPSCSHLSLEEQNESVFNATKIESTRISKSATAASERTLLSLEGSKKQLHQLSDRQQEEEMDVLYAHYLQVALLQSQAKIALEENSKCALEKIHKMWCLAQVYLHKDKAARKCLSLVKCLFESYELLQKKEQVLKSVVNNLPTLKNQYETISTAVDSVRHQLLVKNISLPDSNSEDELIGYLNEVTKLLKEIIFSLPCMDEINSCATNLSAFASNGESLVSEIERCFSIIGKLRNLLLSQASFVL